MERHQAVTDFRSTTREPRGAPITVKDLNFQLKQMCDRNRDGSYNTRADRAWTLSMIANQLDEMGFRHLGAASLKPKHVDRLLARWQAEGLATGTIKNRMSALRWWAQKIGKDNVVARSNAHYGIERRHYVADVSKALELPAGALERVDDPFTRMSLRLQEAFGLRREESIKIQPAWADQGASLRLKPSWTKGGRFREIPVRTEAQRQVLTDAKALAGKGSLIPAALRYVDQVRRFRTQCERAGIHRVHGLRHAYAQARYAELTGWKSPAAGGPHAKQLGVERRAVDREARLAISAELGHEREQITAVYLGR